MHKSISAIAQCYRRFLRRVRLRNDKIARAGIREERESLGLAVDVRLARFSTCAAQSRKCYCRFLGRVRLRNDKIARAGIWEELESLGLPSTSAFGDSA